MPFALAFSSRAFLNFATSFLFFAKDGAILTASFQL